MSPKIEQYRQLVLKGHKTILKGRAIIHLFRFTAFRVYGLRKQLK